VVVRFGVVEAAEKVTFRHDFRITELRGVALDLSLAGNDHGT
jgi:hypothetical protein